jgi:PEGA domain
MTPAKPKRSLNPFSCLLLLRTRSLRSSWVLAAAAISLNAFAASSSSTQSKMLTEKLTQCPNSANLNTTWTPASPAADVGTLAQRRLGQGVAMFDSSRYVLSMDHLKAALALGLADRTETAIANKYLGFYYCIHKAQKLCERHLERALTISPGFDLNPGEKTNRAWRDTYVKVVRRVGDACEKTTDSAKSAGPFTQAAVSEDAMKAGKKSATQGVIELDVRPWGEVYVNSKQVAVTPPSKALSLKPGVHRVEVRNQGGTTLKTLVTVEAGDVTRLTHRF